MEDYILYHFTVNFSQGRIYRGERGYVPLPHQGWAGGEVCDCSVTREGAPHSFAPPGQIFWIRLCFLINRGLSKFVKVDQS